MNRPVIPYGRHSIDEDDVAAVVDVLRHGWLTQGPKVAEFERAIADYVGARHAVAVSSGTAALHIAAAAAGLGTGDTAITSPNTFVASANCVQYVGATAQFADIDPATLNLDPAALERRCAELGPVKAVIPVHFGGLPCDMPAIRRIAEATGARVIEDASHALGATYASGRRVGCGDHADMTVFSFHPVKLMATAEGGMVTTNDDALYRDLLRLRSHGINKEDDAFAFPDLASTDGEQNFWYYEMQELGFNYRLTDLQCALGLSQFAKLPTFLERRRTLARRYDRLLAGLPHIAPAQPQDRERNAHHLYVVRIDYKALGKSRNAFMRALRERSILCQVHYIPAHMQPYYRRNGHAADRFPATEAWYEQALSLPLYYSLTDEEQDYVVAQLKEQLGCA